VTVKTLGAACVLWASAAMAEPPKKAPARVPCEADAKRLAAAVQKPAAKAEEWQARLKDVKAVATRVQKAPGCGELFLDARRREGEALQRVGKADEAKAVLSSVISEWTARKWNAQENPLGTEAAAHARYLLASVTLQVFDDTDLDTTPAGLEKSFSARRDAFKAGLAAFDEVPSFKSPEWTVSAAVRQAEATERFIQMLREPAVPEAMKQVGFEALDRYRSTQDASLPPVEGSLLGAWALAAGRARDLEVDSDDAQVAATAEEKAREAAEATKPKPKAVDPAAEVKAAPVAPKNEKLGLEVGIKVAALLPAGRAGSVSALPDVPAVGQRAVVPAGALALRYRMPFARSLAVAAEGGFTRLGGSGTRTFNNDPDFPSGLTYRWQLDQVPVLLGLAWEIPLDVPLKVAPVAGGAAIYTRSAAGYVSDAGTVANSPQEAWAFGFYAGLEFSLPLGPGSVTLEGRFLSARTDLGLNGLGSSEFYKSVNTTPGDLQGANLLAGYRFSF
jgi:hypothetical protein